MSAELTSPVPGSKTGSPRQRARALRPVAGVLADGAPYYAPIGEVLLDGGRVACHLCGRLLRSVSAHLPAHGWTKAQYCETFGLERGQPLEGPQTRKLRAAALTARLIFEPAIRAGSAAGRDRARAGELARDAAAAAQGRRHPEQRRRKSARAAQQFSAAAAARANRVRADQRLGQIAAGIAAQQGYPDIRSFVLARTQAGASLAAISREAGLHKDWLSRHLAVVDPAAAGAARNLNSGRADAAWFPPLRDLGFTDVASYLRDRHLAGHRTVSAIAAEIGLSNHAVTSALRRHELPVRPHAAKRSESRQRAAAVAAKAGFDSVAAYVTARRLAGCTWQAIAQESGQPPTWLRRHSVPES